MEYHLSILFSCAYTQCSIIVCCLFSDNTIFKANQCNCFVNVCCLFIALSSFYNTALSATRKRMASNPPPAAFALSALISLLIVGLSVLIDKMLIPVWIISDKVSTRIKNKFER